MQSKQAGFSVILIPVIVGIILLGGITATVVTNDQTTPQTSGGETKQSQPTKPPAPPVTGTLNPKQNPAQFCQLNPLYCTGNNINTATLCASNPTFCAQNQILPGQRIVPQSSNPMLNPKINPMANPDINPMANPKINPYANPQINPYVNPKLFPMGPPQGVPSYLNPFSK